MVRAKLPGWLGVILGAFVIASCSDLGVTSPTAPLGVASNLSKGSGDTSGITVSTKTSKTKTLTVQGIWWATPYKDGLKVSKIIGPSGGTISIPECGITMYFPAGAVAAPITIQVVADKNYVAYTMKPAGLVFLKDVTVTQLLKPTAVYDQLLRNPLLAAYINDTVQLSGSVPVLEIVPSTSIFSSLDPLFPEAQVWIIRHFSRYMLASG